MKERYGVVPCCSTSHADECYAAPSREDTITGVVKRLRSARTAPSFVKL